MGYHLCDLRMSTVCTRVLSIKRTSVSTGIQRGPLAMAESMEDRRFIFVGQRSEVF